MSEESVLIVFASLRTKLKGHSSRTLQKDKTMHHASTYKRPYTKHLILRQPLALHVDYGQWCPVHGPICLTDTSNRSPRTFYEGKNGMEQELKTFQLVALKNFSPGTFELIFQVFPILKWKSRSEMQPLWGRTQRASNSPKECHRCVRQGGKWERRS